MFKRARYDFEGANSSVNCMSVKGATSATYTSVLKPTESDRIQRQNHPQSQAHGAKKKDRKEINLPVVKTPNDSFALDLRMTKRPNFVVKSKEMQTYFRLLDDPVIDNFLQVDGCKKIADKYLLSMVFAYFKRAGFTIRDFTKMNFFIALYLANDLEEDEEDFKYEIFPWALGKAWRDKYPGFLRKRDQLWRRIEYRGVVSRRCCDEVMSIEPCHPIWKRERPEYHAGATRGYLKESDDDYLPRGPYVSPRQCSLCDTNKEYDSASPDSTSWYLSSCSDSSTSPDLFVPVKNMHIVPGSRFNMEGLRETLQDKDDIWVRCDEE